jgi:hypothetical protein
VPQLSMNKEMTPCNIRISLDWDQISDDWNVTMVCMSQAGNVTERLHRKLEDGFRSIDLSIAIMRAFENWLDSTPAYARLQLEKALSALCPEEVPVGVTPKEIYRATDPSLGGRPGYTKRQFKPRRR